MEYKKQMEYMEIIKWWFENEYNDITEQEKIHVMTNIAIDWINQFCTKEREQQSA